MIHNLQRIVDMLFPLTKNGMELQKTTPELFISVLSPKEINRVVTLGSYKHPWLQAAIHAYKFEHNRKAGRLLSHLVNSWLQTQQFESTILIPIPLHHKRERERGYNQVAEVLKNISIPQTKHYANLLIRNKSTKPQTSLPRKDRLENLKGAFTCNEKICQQIDWTSVKTVIICDDVLTTGATLEAGRAALAPYLPSHVTLICLAWAH